MSGGRFKDLTGQRFGKLVVLKRLENHVDKHGTKSRWLCKCDCGNTTIADGGRLREGKKHSCGCLQREETSKATSTHHATGSRLHNLWRAMKAGCYIPSCSNYSFYGGRGIKVCAEWKNDFPAFRDWALENGYTDDLSIDRIDSDGDYEPSNCRWITAVKQSHNRRVRCTNRSGVSGVAWRNDCKKWRVTITVNSKTINLGSFTDFEAAVNARRQAEEKYWTEEGDNIGDHRRVSGFC